MRNRLASVAVCTGVVVVGLVLGIENASAGQAGPAAQEPAPIAPMDTAVLRAQYEQVADTVQDVGQVGPDRTGVQGHDEPHHAGEGRERDEACERRDRGVARPR